MDASDTSRLQKARAYFYNTAQDLIKQHPTLNYGALLTNCSSIGLPLTFPSYELKRLFIQGRNSYVKCADYCGR